MLAAHSGYFYIWGYTVFWHLDGRLGLLQNRSGEENSAPAQLLGSAAIRLVTFRLNKRQTEVGRPSETESLTRVFALTGKYILRCRSFCCRL
jgi:hypothetical protein